MGIAQEVLSLIYTGKTGLAALAGALDRDREAVINSVQQLKKRGLVMIEARGAYAITEAGAAWVESGKVIQGGQATPRPRKAARGLRQRVWWVMRARKSATLQELAATLADGHEKDAVGNLSRYMLALERAGFVTAKQQRTAHCAPTSNGCKRYFLARDNGRLAPVVRPSMGVVYDPNLNKTYAMFARAETAGEGV